MDSVGFQVALGDFKSLTGDSVEALVAAWNDGLTRVLNIVAS